MEWCKNCGGQQDEHVEGRSCPLDGFMFDYMTDDCFVSAKVRPLMKLSGTYVFSRLTHDGRFGRAMCD